MCESVRAHKEGCRCHTGRVRGFIQPRILLLLVRKPAHGYELMDALGQGGDLLAPDPGLLYRTLRQFEEDGVVTSAWDTEGAGPARRVYQITSAGREYLDSWVASIRQTRERLDGFVAEYEAAIHDRQRSEQT